MTQLGHELAETHLVESGERKFDPQSVACFTTTLYKEWFPGILDRLPPREELERDPKLLKKISDKVRGDLAIECADIALSRRHRFLIVDGGSSEAFQKRLSEKQIPYLVEPRASMSGSRRLALYRSLIKNDNIDRKIDFLVWSEEKVSFFRDCLDISIGPIQEKRADLVLPKRNEKSWDSYPPLQADSEKEANEKINRILKGRGVLPQDAEDLDFMFGPRIIANNDIVSLFFNEARLAKKMIRGSLAIAKPEAWFNFNFAPVIMGLFYKYRVVGVEVPYQHSNIQTSLELNTKDFNRKRVIQRIDLAGTTALLVNLLAYLQGNPSPPNRALAYYKVNEALVF